MTAEQDDVVADAEIHWRGTPQGMPFFLPGDVDLTPAFGVWLVGAWFLGVTTVWGILWAIAGATLLGGRLLTRWLVRKRSRYALVGAQLVVTSELFGRVRTRATPVVELDEPLLAEHRDGTGTIGYGSPSRPWSSPFVLHRIDDASQVLALLERLRSTADTEIATGPESRHTQGSRRTMLLFALLTTVAAVFTAIFGMQMMQEASGTVMQATVEHVFPRTDDCPRRYGVAWTPSGSDASIPSHHGGLCAGDQPLTVGEVVRVRVPAGGPVLASQRVPLRPGFVIAAVVTVLGAIGWLVAWRRPELLNRREFGPRRR